MKHILVGASGSIACYKTALLVRQLRAHQCTVQVMLTPAAALLVGAPTFRALSGEPVLQEEWQQPQSKDGMDHIAAVRRADLLLIAPASADFIAKAANGIADNLLLASFLAAECPIYLAPAMNRQMWAAAATQRNLAQLQADGVTILGPASGEQACGENGTGRMLEVEEIISAALAPQPLAGRQIVVSTGATVENLDTMRTISNHSSGQMGFCLAQAAKEMGATVRCVAAQTSCPPPANIPLRRAISNKAMQQAVLEETATADWFFSAAAIADFCLAQPATQKIAREKGEWTLTLTPTDDILSAVVKARPHLNCLAFAAQSGSAKQQETAARQKMQKKGVKFIALNDAQDAGNPDNQLTLLYKGGKVALPRLPKMAAARALLFALVSRETATRRTT